MVIEGDVIEGLKCDLKQSNQSGQQGSTFRSMSSHVELTQYHVLQAHVCVDFSVVAKNAVKESILSQLVDKKSVLSHKYSV